MTVVMVIYLSQTTPIGFDCYVDHQRQWSYISSDDTSKRYKCDVTVVKVIYLSQTTQVRQDLTAVLITRDSGMSNTDIRMDASTNSMEGNNDEMWFWDNDYLVEDEMGEAEEQLQLVTADAHTQRDVHLGLYEQQPVSGQDHVMKFKASGVKGMQMSMLQSMHDNKQVMAAVGLLRQWHWITMDAEPVNMTVARHANYPEPLTLELVKALMEVLGCFKEQHWNIKLRLNDMKAFHQHFINSWAEWVRKVPASWKQDGFLMENMPVGVCLQYAQSQPIMVSQALEEERTNWSRDQNFSYLDVQRWHNMSVERITWNHGEVCDKPDHDPSRVAVDLRELDLLDDNGYEINMYNKAGWQVPRQIPKELQSLHELFQGRDEVHGEMMNEVEFWVYPLAFTQKYGNMKAHGIIPNMAGHVGKLNKLIFKGGMEDDDMDVDKGGEDRVQLAGQNPGRIHRAVDEGDRVDRVEGKGGQGRREGKGGQGMDKSEESVSLSMCLSWTDKDMGESMALSMCLCWTDKDMGESIHITVNVSVLDRHKHGREYFTVNVSISVLDKHIDSDMLSPMSLSVQDGHIDSGMLSPMSLSVQERHIDNAMLSPHLYKGMGESMSLPKSHLSVSLSWTDKDVGKSMHSQCVCPGQTKGWGKHVTVNASLLVVDRKRCGEEHGIVNVSVQDGHGHEEEHATVNVSLQDRQGHGGENVTVNVSGQDRQNPVGKHVTVDVSCQDMGKSISLSMCPSRTDREMAESISLAICLSWADTLTVT
ncbi:hypothetical protein EDC04DRAFT_2604158 [Pisolithus marmoratus]|nr:hypothetical protein EDC04DRAFT_2604158 [Pisolithus marmoratus]